VRGTERGIKRTIVPVCARVQLCSRCRPRPISRVCGSARACVCLWCRVSVSVCTRVRARARVECVGACVCACVCVCVCVCMCVCARSCDSERAVRVPEEGTKGVEKRKTDRATRRGTAA